MANNAKYRKHLIASAEAMGFRDVTIVQNGHIKIYGWWGSQQYGPWVFPSSPSNNIGWTQKGVKGQIRTVLRRQGVVIENNKENTMAKKTKPSLTRKDFEVVKPKLTHQERIELGRKRLAEFRQWQQQQKVAQV